MEESTFVEKIEKIKMPIRIVILVGTLVVFGGLFTWFYYLPQVERIHNTKMEIVKLEKELKGAKARSRHLAKFQKELKDVNERFKQALAILPNSKEIPKLLRTITRLGAESNLQFDLFSPRGERKKNFYNEIPVSIRVTGQYHDVATFFDKVGQMDRIVNILNVSMKPQKALSTTLSTQCTAITYRFKGGAAAKPKKRPRKKK